MKLAEMEEGDYAKEMKARRRREGKDERVLLWQHRDGGLFASHIHRHNQPMSLCLDRKHKLINTQRHNQLLSIDQRRRSFIVVSS